MKLEILSYGSFMALIEFPLQMLIFPNKSQSRLTRGMSATGLKRYFLTKIPSGQTLCP
jgi:hypothetical protein